jgi:aerobic-type carbon monoxide dehydrogenase small subunit (CoxS/CutS family)
MASTMKVSLQVNGETHTLDIEPQETLLHVLRERMGLTGTKSNCEEGECGACTVLLDGRPVNSCLLLAVRAQGFLIQTIEGLTSAGRHAALQAAFAQEGAIQCGYCTPGFVLAAAALLDDHPTPTEDEIVYALSGNICRCTGYLKILKAVTNTGNGVVPR